MMLIIGVIFTLTLLVLVVAPLLAPDSASASTLPVDVTPQVDLKRRRLVLYENLQDLEFEYKAGKLSPDDYNTLRLDYKAEAAELMAASQDLEITSTEDAFIERAVAANVDLGPRQHANPELFAVQSAQRGERPCSRK